MGNKNTATSEKKDMSTGSPDLDSLLDDLDIQDASPDSIEEIVEEIEETTAEASAEVTDEDLEGVNADLEREEVYATQESTGDVDAGAVEEKKTEKGKKASGQKRQSTPRTPRDMNSVAPEFFVLEGDLSKMSDDDKNKAKVDTIAANPTQKKIAEKFENLFTSISAGKAPSRYVVDAFKFLNGKKTMSSSDLIAHYQAAGLGTGTARSQSGQIMNLFAAVKIASRSNQTLTLNEKSVVADRLRKILGL